LFAFTALPKLEGTTSSSIHSTKRDFWPDRRTGSRPFPFYTGTKSMLGRAAHAGSYLQCLKHLSGPGGLALFSWERRFRAERDRPVGK